MSREWDHYDVECSGCGATGSIRMWSDDWNRWGTEWDGFKGMTYVTGPKPERVECEKCGSSNPAIIRR
ncbi:hypothetical protein [Novosphingobium sp. CECT 9465]|uniref:hypothetical protein n=1 Tax=Novosphingobium sp. CECT 9465 TaxID=2829794 RepID=UPI001E5D459E|nr:hypothetical protein [Novosphingobium sp. CECT 9465]CAH0498425.1 hypothetical protein NVSP9465_03512 [Novosphingobium sp. CECT 9465]